jgi:CubicO group peptidase (beta-lactamase class C family)
MAKPLDDEGGVVEGEAGAGLHGLAFDFCFDDREPTEAQLVASLSGYPLLHTPGTKYQYSNLGFALLGLVVARASHVPLRDFVTSRSSKPLGMTSTTFDPPGRLPTGYQKIWRGALTPQLAPRGAHLGFPGLAAHRRAPGRRGQRREPRHGRERLVRLRLGDGGCGPTSTPSR